MSAARSRTHTQAVDAAIELFTRQGYEQTTVEDIADAANISRATFFRRFRSKEDVIFADHELLLDEVVVLLAETRPEARGEIPSPEVRPGWDRVVDPYVEVCRAARLVFDHHVAQRETSVARHRLLQQVPTLRDRELVTTHRYERAFTAYLRDTLPDGARTSTASVAFAASVVAVHNAILRRWLRNPQQDLRPDLEEAFADLRRTAAPRGDAGTTAARTDAVATPGAGSGSATGLTHRPGTGAGEDAEGARRVVVTVIDADAPADDVAAAVARAVREHRA